MVVPNLLLKASAQHIATVTRQYGNFFNQFHHLQNQPTSVKHPQTQTGACSLERWTHKKTQYLTLKKKHIEANKDIKNWVNK